MAAASQPVCVEPINQKSKTKLYVYVGTHVNSGCRGKKWHKEHIHGHRELLEHINSHPWSNTYAVWGTMLGRGHIALHWIPHKDSAKLDTYRSRHVDEKRWRLNLRFWTAAKTFQHHTAEKMAELECKLSYIFLLLVSWSFTLIARKAAKVATTPAWTMQ